MPRTPKGKKTVFDKVKDLDPSFAEEVSTMTDLDLKEKVVTLTKYSMEIEEARQDDQDLASLKEQLKVANQTYSEPLKANKLKRQLILDVLKSRGKLS
ncbi:hypothetical protein EBU95_03775 [bacterium]|nr:hypothetical protein [bacterium]